MSRYAMCPECGRRMRRVTDEWGRWDGETYSCDYCSLDYDYDDDEDYGDECLDVYDAAQIWAANGKDDDDTFGYSVEELEDALNN